jgi:hypothetical protein
VKEYCCGLVERSILANKGQYMYKQIHNNCKSVGEKLHIYGRFRNYVTEQRNLYSVCATERRHPSLLFIRKSNNVHVSEK